MVQDWGADLQLAWNMLSHWIQQPGRFVYMWLVCLKNNTSCIGLWMPCLAARHMDHPWVAAPRESSCNDYCIYKITSLANKNIPKVKIVFLIEPQVQSIYTWENSCCFFFWGAACCCKGYRCQAAVVVEKPESPAAAIQGGESDDQPPILLLVWRPTYGDVREAGIQLGYHGIFVRNHLQSYITVW